MGQVRQEGKSARDRGDVAEHDECVREFQRLQELRNDAIQKGSKHAWMPSIVACPSCGKRESYDLRGGYLH